MAPKGGIKQRLGIASGKAPSPTGSARRRSRTPTRQGRLSEASGSSSRPLAVTSAQVADLDLRAVVRELFMTNELSAAQASRVARAGQASGAQGVEDLAAAGARGTNKNIHRDLMRSLTKGCVLPPLYMAKVPVWNNGGQELVDFPLLLPHEVLAHLHKANPQLLARALPSPEVHPELCAIVATTEQELKTGPCLVPLGLHGDGVPYTKGQSLEAVSWNLVAQPLWERVLFAAVPKQFCCQCSCKGKHTWDAILQVFAWSMHCLLLGVHPSLRHDGQPLDKQRQALASQPLGCKATLLQARGDWPFLKQLFQFPSWNATRMCWKCKATQETYKLCHLGAPWRSQRLSSTDFLQELHSSGGTPSPLLSCPGFKLDFVGIDWLHTVDLGVAQDVLGNLFWEALSLEEGTRRNQLQALWSKIQAFYREHKPSSQLDALTLEMLYQPGKSPKLKAKGGETRYLVPFGAQLAQQCYLTNSTKHWEAVATLLSLLLQIYQCVAQVPFEQAKGAELTRKFSILFQVLAQEAAENGVVAWVQKPKLHLFQELMEYSAIDLGSPQHFWTYRDEAWVGWLGQAAHRRGGQDTPVCAATRALTRYRALASEAPDFSLS